MEKFCIKDINCCHGSPMIDAMFTQILAFLEFFSITSRNIENKGSLLVLKSINQ